MAKLSTGLPPLPEIGHPESYYASMAKMADLSQDIHAHEAAKVGQYVTLGLDPHRHWDSKLKYFRHALRRHCEPPRVADDLVSMFYQRLGDMVRRYCGQEALRIASAADDRFAARLHAGDSREAIGAEAKALFDKLMGPRDEESGDECPTHYNEEDWQQLRLLRMQWVQ